MCVYGILAGQGTCDCGGVCECATAPSGKPYTGEICECYPDVDECQATDEAVSACVCVGVCLGVRTYICASEHESTYSIYLVCIRAVCMYVRTYTRTYVMPV